MQTFLPYPDFVQTARCLDWRRLGKQRVECLQIIETILHGSQWSHHPAVLMWDGFIPALAEYGGIICLEWKRRGYVDHLFRRIAAHGHGKVIYPSWLGNEAFHASHRGNLLRKDKHYKQFGWTESPELPYVWPAQ